MSEVTVRYFLWQDIKAVIRIENESYTLPWVEDDFVTAMRKTDSEGRVVETDGEIIGYVIYALHRPGTFPMQTLSAGGIEILNLTVAESSRGDGIGALVIDYLKNEIQDDGEPSCELSMIVGDDALDAQLFLVSQEFRAVRVLRGIYDNGEDAYLLSWSEIPDLSIPAIRWANRIASYL